MIRRSNFQLLQMLCMIAVNTHAQDEQSPFLNIGDPAPPLRVREWLKGTPVQRFEKGHVYVLEFWATWCAPCKAAMPHLSALAREYKDRVTILGIDVMEMKNTSREKVKAFVDSMGPGWIIWWPQRIAIFKAADWLVASGEQIMGIPRTIVVNAEGRLAWMGHPKYLSEVLPKIVNNDWDIKEALAKRNLAQTLT